MMKIVAPLTLSMQATQTPAVAATHPAYRPDIDGLRAVAVLAVLINHAFPHMLPGGFAGVDVFFVISGFLITTILLKSLERGAFSLSDFYSRRILRLFPVLLVVLLFSLVVGAFVFLPDDYEKLALNTLGGGAFVANLLLATDTGYFAGIAEFNPLLHLWSLGIEEQFYLVWPPILWLVVKLGRPVLVALIIVLLVVLSFIYSNHLVATDRSWAFYSPFSRFWELGAGGLLACLTLQPGPLLMRVVRFANACLMPFIHTPREPGAALRHLASFVGLVCIVTSYVLLSTVESFPGTGALMPVVGSVLLIAAGPRAIVNRFILSSRFMVGVGLISYPLYLWHWPLLSFAATANTNDVGTTFHIATLALLALSFLLAWLSYRYIEQPLRRPGLRARKVAALVLTMLFVIFAALVIRVLDGMPQRLPAGLRDVLAANPRNETWKNSLRPGICHNVIYTGTGLGVKENCYPDGKPSIMLWGDSHAASLYSGLQHWQKNGQPFTIWQYTTDATAPLFTSEIINNMRKTLSEINGPALERLHADAPDILLFHAIWQNYSGDPHRLADLLENAIRLTRLAAPGMRVVVLGPVPVWRGNLQQNIFNYYWQHGATAPGSRMHFGLIKPVFAFDVILNERITKAGVTYISAINELCTEQGCLTRIGPGLEGLTYVDGQHLSAGGAAYLAEKILPALLEQYDEPPHN